jgi:uncharacterized protein (TIGR02466 family)
VKTDIMTEKTVWPLFSKPIFRAPVDIGNIDLSSVKWARNYQNWISESQDILGSENFRDLGEKCQQIVKEYFYNIMMVSPKVEIYITESWLNKTEKGQSHHRHWHPNSILSGVLYLESEGETGNIRFITSQYDTLEFQVMGANVYNSKSWSITPRAGDMLVFPSNTEHLVDYYEGEIPRISLSFNTFVRGEINSDPLTKLNI